MNMEYDMDEGIKSSFLKNNSVFVKPDSSGIRVAH